MNKLSEHCAARTMLSLLLAAAIAFSFCSCGIIKTVSAAELTADVKKQDTDGKDIDDAFIIAYDDFAAKLLAGSIKGSKGNVLVSPLSVQLCLGMIANGTAGVTLKEMEGVIGNGMEIKALNMYLCGLMKKLNASKECRLNIGNSLWLRNGFAAKNGFLQNCVDYYDARVYASPFDDSTIKDINKWVKDATDGSIDKIIDNIDANDMMFLVNALDFEGEWHSKYEKKQVREHSFTNSDGSSASVSMMFSTENRYLEKDGVIGFEKYYKDRNFAFAALLPEEGTDIYEFAESLTGEKLKDILDSMQIAEVSTGMPKFKSEYEINLNNVLSAMGMPTAFTENADFSAASDDKDLYLSYVYHKTYIEVDEQKTKASAVTIGTVAELEAAFELHTVILNRPYVYMIMDMENNLPLFIGVNARM